MAMLLVGRKWEDRRGFGVINWKLWACGGCLIGRWIWSGSRELKAQDEHAVTAWASSSEERRLDSDPGTIVQGESNTGPWEP